MAGRTQQERREATRAALVDAARAAFGAEGFAATSTTSILEAAGVSRGAMYHHFADKSDLFAAVWEQLADESMERLAGAALGAGEPLAGLRAGIDAWLDSLDDPALVRIALLDAPTALGFERWQELEETHFLGLVTFSLQAAIDAGAIRADLDVEALAHALLGALQQAGLHLSRSPHPEVDRPAVSFTLHALLDGLRP